MIAEVLGERLALTVASVVSVAGLATYFALTVVPYFQAITSALQVVR